MAKPVVLTSQLSRESPALILVNPTAGGGRARAILPRVQAYLASQGWPAEFILTTSVQDLEMRARQAIARGRHTLLAMGGDGTLQGLVNAAAGADVVLGVFPAGGGNDFAAALGLPRDPIAAAHAVLRGQPRWVDLSRVRTADGRTRLYAGGGGLGLDAEAARYASGAYRQWPGTLRYVASALRALRGFTPSDVCAEFPGQGLPPMQANVLLASVLNTPTYGAGLRLAPDGRVDDGWLDVVFIEDLSVLEVLALLPVLARNGDVRIPQLKRTRARSLRLTADRPCVFHGDGEIIGPAPVDIEVVPQAVRVLAPRPQDG